jgi:hypothetical protein
MEDVAKLPIAAATASGSKPLVEAEQRGAAAQREFVPSAQLWVGAVIQRQEHPESPYARDLA